MPSKMKETVSDRKPKGETNINQNGKKSNNQKTDEEKAAKQKYFKQISNRINAFLDPDSKTGFQQQDLARALGMEKQGFNAYMKAETHFFSVQMLEKISNYLGCSVDHLLGKYDEKTKTLSEMAEYTRLSGEALEILHEAVTINSNGYQLFIDLFEYMLRRYKKYLNYEDHAQAASDPVDTMMLYVSEALRFNLIKRTQTKETEKMFKDAAQAEAYLSEGGFTVIPVESGYYYALQEASESFIKLLRQFIQEKIDKDPEYAKRIWDPSIFNRALIDSLFKTTILSSGQSQNEENKKYTEKEEAHELPVL